MDGLSNESNLYGFGDLLGIYNYQYGEMLFFDLADVTSPKVQDVD